MHYAIVSAIGSWRWLVSKVRKSGWDKPAAIMMWWFRINSRRKSVKRKKEIVA